MRWLGVLLAVALFTGTVAGLALTPSLSAVDVRVWLLAAVAALGAAWRGWSVALCVLAVVVLAGGGAVLAGTARQHALTTSVRQVLHERFGGFRIDTLGPGGDHDPVPARFILLEDASSEPPGARVRGRVTALRLDGQWVPVDGGVSLSVAGTVDPERFREWRAGRTVEAPVTFRRPTRYLNDGVTDAEVQLALAGTTLFAGTKSGMLLEVLAPAGWRQERGADARALVRDRVRRFVGRHDALSAAIVAAILIGDRSGLSPEVRERLQDAGIYHVLAISGGNIAILVGLVLIVVRSLGAPSAVGAALTLVVLAGYAQVVTVGPSVLRAVLMATAVLAARVLDHRTPPLHSMALAGSLGLAVSPLDALDPGFVLTFAATGALLGAATYAPSIRHGPRLLRWALAVVIASAAVELVLYPVGALLFGRITLVGLVLNLAAVPLMTVVQVAGMVVALGGMSDVVGNASGWVAHVAARALVQSSYLVDVLGWLVARVPPPPWFLVAVHYLAVGCLVWSRGVMRVVSGAVLATAMVCTVMLPQWPMGEDGDGRLHLTMFDVGQGEALSLRWPAGGTSVVDTGGQPFGTGQFDIGDRVLRPALWASGVARVHDLLITHGDPDHIGGAAAVLDSFAPRRLLEGVVVPGHEPSVALRRQGLARGAVPRALVAGDTWRQGSVDVRVLWPEAPDWERRRVRNDDSVVLELRYGDVAVLLTGDVSADVERQILPRLSPARVRVLKVGHHGSRSSSSHALVDAWRPQVALISCGRGNRFGHPAPEVLRRLEAVGASVYRTDRDGAVQLSIDGRALVVETFVGRARARSTTAFPDS